MALSLPPNGLGSPGPRRDDPDAARGESERDGRRSEHGGVPW
ncbi:hypothetical protein [Halalkalicoccus sp. NIPERK01]|nr:hypothetical protein [Halalkalicoccus sp. NIPERK01]MDL5362810.1 hypothetical protein [Halalkalicoccus sp. NIPERK01]